MKRIISILLFMTVLLSSLSLPVLVQGEGEPQEPYAVEEGASGNEADMPSDNSASNDDDVTPPANTEDGNDVTPPADTEDGNDVTPPADTEDGNDATPPADTEGGNDVTPPADTEDGNDVTPPADTEDGNDVTPPADTEDGNDVTPPADTEDGNDVTPPADEEEDGAEESDAIEPKRFERGYVRVAGETKVYEQNAAWTAVEKGSFPGSAVVYAVLYSQAEDPANDWLKIYFDTKAAQEAEQGLYSGFVQAKNVTILSDEQVEALDLEHSEVPLRSYNEHLLPLVSFQEKVQETAADTSAEEEDGEDVTPPADKPNQDGNEVSDPNSVVTPPADTEDGNDDVTPPADTEDGNDDVTPPADTEDGNDDVTPPADTEDGNDDVTPPADTEDGNDDATPPADTEDGNDDATPPADTEDGNDDVTPPADTEDGEDVTPPADKPNQDGNEASNPKNGSAIVITSQTRDIYNVEVGTPYPLEVVAEGKEPLSYRWKVSTNGGVSFRNSTAPGFNTATMTITVSSEKYEGYQYYCVISDVDGHTENSAIVTIHFGAPSAIVIETQPVGGTFTEGEQFTLSVTATGDALTYAWYFSADGETWNPVEGGNSATLTRTAELAQDGYQYKCHLKDSHGQTKDSDAVTVTVTPSEPPVEQDIVITSQPQDIYNAEVGTPYPLEVVAEGKEPLSYRWKVSTNGGVSFKYSTAKGYKTATLTITVSSEKYEGYQYYCEISDVDGKMVESAVVTVHFGPQNLEDDTFKYEKTADSQGLIVTEYKLSETEALVPAVFNNLPVVSIDDNAFAGKQVLIYQQIDATYARVYRYTGSASSLTVSGTIQGLIVKEIGVEAFMGNTSLVSVTLPNSIEIIKARAFKNCINLAQMDNSN